MYFSVSYLERWDQAVRALRQSGRGLRPYSAALPVFMQGAIASSSPHWCRSLRLKRGRLLGESACSARMAPAQLPSCLRIQRRPALPAPRHPGRAVRAHATSRAVQATWRAANRKAPVPAKSVRCPHPRVRRRRTRAARSACRGTRDSPPNLSCSPV